MSTVYVVIAENSTPLRFRQRKPYDRMREQDMDAKDGDGPDGHVACGLGILYRCVYERAWHTLLSWRVCVVRTAVHVQ